MSHRRHRELRRGHGSRRALKLAAVVERDGQSCWICGELVDLSPDPTGAEPMRASLDHVMELAEGGSNALGNLKLAHQLCNGSRRATSART